MVNMKKYRTPASEFDPIILYFFRKVDEWFKLKKLLFIFMPQNVFISLDKNSDLSHL